VFRFPIKLSDSEFKDAKFEIKIFHRRPFLTNVLVGTICVKAKTINHEPNHEFYRRWERVEFVENKKSSFAGRLQFSCVIFSEENFKHNPKLPIHMYDLEVVPLETRKYARVRVLIFLKNATSSNLYIYIYRLQAEAIMNAKKGPK
jgi:hypothetical protein